MYAWAPHGKFVSALIVTVLMAACNNVQKFRQTEQERAALAERFAIRGAWSKAMNGLECRILLSADTLRETECLDVGLEVRNMGEEAVTITDIGSPPFCGGTGRSLHWWMGEGRVFAHPRSMSCRIYSARMTISPHDNLAMGPAWFRVPPGEGTRHLSAIFAAGEEELRVPAVAVQVAPAEWGNPSNGVRLRIAAQDPTVAPTSPLVLTAFLHNMERQRLLMSRLAWQAPEIIVQGNLITAIYRPERSAGCSAHGLLAAFESYIGWAQFPEPGEYALRIVIEADEIMTPEGPTWSGRLASNEIGVTVLRGDAPIYYRISTPLRTCAVDEPLPLELTVKNLCDHTIHFLDFADRRNVELGPILELSCPWRSCPWIFKLPLASGTPKPAPPKRGVRGAFSIVELPAGATYRIRFPNIITAEVKRMLDGLTLPQQFRVSFRWSKSLWRDSATWPFESADMFLHGWNHTESTVHVTFVP